MRFILLIMTLIVSQLSLAGFSDIDLLVRETLDQEFSDGETCPDFYNDYFDFQIFQKNNKLCEFSVLAKVRLTSCFSSQEESPVLEAEVCVLKEVDGTYEGHFVEAWRSE